MLGRSRARALHDAVEELRGWAGREAEVSSSMRHLPIVLEASSAVGANHELAQRLEAADADADWFYVIGVRADGTRVAYASDRVKLRTLGQTDITTFLLFDQWASLDAWRLTHLWRVSDLADASYAALGRWEIIPAAACARALLEGVAAFVVEGAQLIAEWSSFKRRGTPDLDSLESFRRSFGGLLLKAQMGSRVTDLIAERPALKRQNVLTFLQKLDRGREPSLFPDYDWLSDAVHPSFGFGSTYTVTQGVHKSGSTFAQDVARRPHLAATRVRKIEPTVAITAANVVVNAVNEFAEAFPRVSGLRSDIGLTSGAAFAVTGDAGGSLTRPGRNSPCPCGSGRKFKSCGHQWGDDFPDGRTWSTTSNNA